MAESAPVQESTSSATTTSTADIDRRFIDGKWYCFKNADFYIYENDRWTRIDEDDIEDLNDKWNKTQSIAQAPSLNRFVDGRWIVPRGDTFFEAVGDEWKEVDPNQVPELKLKYAAQDPYRKVHNGQEYNWNHNLQQWIPAVNIDEDFIARYQAQYGVQHDFSQLPPSEKELKLKELEEKQAAKEQKKRKREENAKTSQWTKIDEEHDTHVYVSGLPTSITEEEFLAFMTKVGVVMKDPRTNKPKIKLYRTPEGDPKGDGTCCYVKIESVELALTILDGYNLDGHIVHVEKAKFQMKGDFDPSKKKKRLTVDQKKKFIERQNKAFEWNPDKPRNYRPPSDCTVILKNVFDLDEMVKDVTLALDLKEIIKERCERFGEIKKIIVYENHSEGVVSITFNTVEEADYCIKMLDRGIMRTRNITAETWDGKTKYNVKEREEDVKRRDEQWKEFLKDDDESDGEEQQPEDV